MPSSCTLYLSIRDLPAGLLDVPALGGTRLAIERMTDPVERERHLHGFCGYVMHCRKGEMDQATFELIQRIRRTRHVVGIRIEPSFDEASIGYVRQLRAATGALLFLGSAVLDLQERVLIGPNGADPEASLPQFESALARKARSEKRATELGIPVLASLPPIAADEEIVLRSPREIAQRALCLWAVAVRGEGLDLGSARRIIDQAGAWDWVTAKERAFLETQQPTEHERTPFAWQYECLWVLGWALGLFDDLSTPAQICDVPRLAKAMMHASVDALAAAGLRRSAQEILDQTDFIYRAHWAVTEARVNPKKHAVRGLEPGVVLEQHRALNWLTSYQNQDWDDVSTDT